MQYLEYNFSLSPRTETATDVLTGLLADIGFESFMEQPDGTLSAYIPKASFLPSQLETALQAFPLPGTDITYTCTEPEDKDWNEEWEKNFFRPIVIEGRCVVHSTFHRDLPQAEYDIVINPQMAFGTGHHETTSLMLAELLDTDLPVINISYELSYGETNYFSKAFKRKVGVTPTEFRESGKRAGVQSSVR